VVWDLLSSFASTRLGLRWTFSAPIAGPWLRGTLHSPRLVNDPVPLNCWCMLLMTLCLSEDSWETDASVQTPPVSSVKQTRAGVLFVYALSVVVPCEAAHLMSNQTQTHKHFLNELFYRNYLPTGGCLHPPFASRCLSTWSWRSARTGGDYVTAGISTCFDRDFVFKISHSITTQIWETFCWIFCLCVFFLFAYLGVYTHV